MKPCCVRDANRKPRLNVMAESTQYDVFMSYSHHDRRDIRSLAERLQSDGLRVWLDEWSVRPDGNLSADINLGLDQAAVLIVCLSSSSSQSTWRRLETQTFLFRNRHRHSRRVLVLRLDDSQRERWLERFDVIDWRHSARENSYPKLLSTCRSID
jgi:hypothetical protein